jgi:hypothetical protein
MSVGACHALSRLVAPRRGASGDQKRKNERLGYPTQKPGLTEENNSVQARSYLILFRGIADAMAASSELIEAGFAVAGRAGGTLKLTAAGASKVKTL